MTFAVAHGFNISFANRQRSRPVNLRAIRPIVETLLGELLGIKFAELGVSFVAAPEMARLNVVFLRHAGSTDVISFDYSELGTRDSEQQTRLHGEIFICVDEAIRQARRFRTTWQSEIVRYLVHGVLHLIGCDDQRAADRRKMKREENRLLRSLAARFPLSWLARKPKVSA